ncbi:hypothetical protein ACFVZ3_07845 [Kitasatospora purpeofusca]|uniref:hypothetical protein n=1 Tax=Kitasatospora purpeofusca TaxID=67352 RepID=UPI0036C8D169
MTALLEPLDKPQQLLVDTVWSQFAQAQRFPVFRYVEHVMRKAGHNAEAVLRSFPTLGQHILPHGYSAVAYWDDYTRIRPESPVHLTLAGLHHVREDVSQGICRMLLGVMRVVTKDQERILQHPFDVHEITTGLHQAVRLSGGPGMYLPWATVVAEREWPGLHLTPSATGGDVGTGHLVEADFDTTADYLAAVTAALTLPEPPDDLPYGDPRALLRALSFLDVTHELVLGSALVDLPPMDRSSLLALPVGTEAEFAAGITVLSEILGKFKVPGKKPSAGHGRLPDHLATVLPSIDGHAVGAAVDVLDHVRVLRNSTVHPKPSPALLAAHERLGLTFPVADFAAAWDRIRAHAERAVSTLQEAIYAART